jgi:Tol biopolymer transport system component/DNA-binding winged helix-turn-helix (wHTH) protein
MSNQQSHLYEFGPYRLLPQERRLLRHGEPVPLTPKAFETLVALVRRAGRLADKEELLQEVWPETFVEESNLAQNVFALRKALGAGENGKPYIETVSKRGYRFLASVRVIEDNDAEVFVGQHVSAKTKPHPADLNNAELPPLLVTGGGRQSIILTQSGGSAALAENRQALQRSTVDQTVGRAIQGWKGLIAGLVIFAILTGLGALTYRALSHRGAAPSFQTMKITRLTTTGKSSGVAISPDGKYVVHVQNDGGQQSLWIRQVATQRNVQIVAPAPVSYVNLTFSPDGNYVYYTVSPRNVPPPILFRVSALGGVPKKLLENVVGHAISFSPAGNQFAFFRFVPGKESALMIANADCTEERKLVTYNPGEAPSNPAWSPDGTRIAYAVMNLQTNDQAIFEARVADGVTKPLTAQRWFRINKLAWLVDGSGLVMLATPEQSFGRQIWQLSYPEGEVQRLTNDLNDYRGMSLTSDSKTLALVKSETQANIWIAPDNDASRVRSVTSGSGKFDHASAWTPDGRILYHSDVSGTDDIWIVDPDGGNPEQLTSNARLNQGPAVSPDGRYVVFMSDRNGLPHIWRMKIDGSDQRQLTNGPGEQNPQFSPDGRWVVYRTTFRPSAWKIPVEGGEAVPLTNNNAYGPTVSPDGQWVAYVYNDNGAVRLAIAPLGRRRAPQDVWAFADL